MNNISSKSQMASRILIINIAVTRDAYFEIISANIDPIPVAVIQYKGPNNQPDNKTNISPILKYLEAGREIVKIR